MCCAMHVGVAKVLLAREFDRELMQKNPTEFLWDLICSGHHVKHLTFGKPKGRRIWHSRSDHLLIPP
jgi:hypothetical protein